ncbi:MAG TPA: threonine--tRNA ligase, partial [Planctomycetaceae bacterium]|nr:threonine--tRNA ligase [Planctomycetaceae bacterium]
REMDLFHFQEEGPGVVFWHPKGWSMFQTLVAYMRRRLAEHGYDEVNAPQLLDKSLWETSGHWGWYQENMFAVKSAHAFTHPDDKEADQRIFALKPMNCPCHVEIFNQGLRSYRELPLRMAEMGSCHRFEPSGALHGILRVRNFTQDDAHIFCTEEQAPDEFRSCIDMTKFVLGCLGLDNYRVRLGFRDPTSDKYVGSPELWDRAQRALVEVCESLGIEATQEEGEAAFYGPKADFVVTDCLGREWQLGTVQLDYNLPSAERFDLQYIGADNTAHRPVMIHRAPLGSMERFMGVLIEHFAGAFPLWLAPEQIRILPVSEKTVDYARGLEQRLREQGFRVSGDWRAEKLGAKIRDAQLELIPYMAVVGPRDEENGTISLRDRVDGDLGALPVDQVIARLTDEVRTRRVRQTFSGGKGINERSASHEY